MSSKGATNIILRLKEEGWDGNKINAFIAFIEAHSPTDEEVKRFLEHKD